MILFECSKIHIQIQSKTCLLNFLDFKYAAHKIIFLIPIKTFYLQEDNINRAEIRT